MTRSFKIVYIGAGSFRFTIPCTLNILDFADTYHPIELWLVDIDVNSLRSMGKAVRQLVYMHNKDIKIHLTTDRRKALPEADIILISISVGLQKSEWLDIFIPLKFGIPQNTGDTVGPGGIFRGVRTIPIIVDIIKDAEELCPQATILNYTNPQGFIMLAAIQAAPNLQSIGLCHELFHVNTKKFGNFLRLCGVDPARNEKFRFKYGGLNHFSWITEISYGGEDLYPKMRDNAEYAYTSEKFQRPFNYYLMKKLGYFNYVEDRHVAEFMPQYYNYFNYKNGPFGMTKLRNVDGLNKLRHITYSLIRWGSRDRSRWFVRLVLRPMEGGEKALLMIKDKLGNRPKHHVCNILNNGTIPSLPNNCVIEVPCYFRDNKLSPTKIGALPKEINELVKLHAENQQLVVDAALSGNSDTLFKALLADPMCQFIEDEEKIEAIVKNILFYEQKWLPKFSESIPTLNDLKKLKFFIDLSELSSVKSAESVKYPPDSRFKAKAWPQKE